MSLEIAKPEILKYFVAHSLDGSVVHEGFVTPEQVVTTGQPELLPADTESEHLNNLSPYADEFPPLPAQGEHVEAGQIYNSGGTLVMARQSHDRTEHDPATIPALFAIYQPGEGILPWVAGELIQKGMVREYQGSNYIYVGESGYQAQVGHEPDIAVTIWQPYVPVGDTWVDSGETVVALVGAGTIQVTDTAPFGATQPIRINGSEATVSSIFTPGVNGIIVISPHIPVTGGEMIEILG